MRISDWSSDVCSSDLKNGGIREWTLATEDSLRGESFADRSHWEPTGRAAIAWQPARALTLRAAGYFSYRLPTLNELYRPFRVGADTTVANAALRPERLAGVEAGVEFQPLRSEEHTSELQSLMRISYAVFCSKKRMLQPQQ